MSALKNFARRNFGGRRTFGSKLGRAFRLKNPFARKITLGSMVMRPAERVVSMTIMQTADGAILAAAGALGVGVLKVVKNVGSSVFDTAKEYIGGDARREAAAETRTSRQRKIVDDESAH